ncbi:LOW QUALITY PROTEIN: uncharacterized protein LOC114770965 [Denticeps clupeoides]|uniref:LOW QUALITY PROTEIN: uncharacterized protein LOC114770965 n=1 Tax=Denticeps clupeoides TaxID=299321 RepID=UPI0010A46D10|nr:LOW QUALITY PROTEIN: uncharacterized protein LOC114770965 [Denticeps clupeoides]
MKFKVFCCICLLGCINTGSVLTFELLVDLHSSVELPCAASLDGSVITTLLGAFWSHEGSVIASYSPGTNDTDTDDGFYWETSKFQNGSFPLMIQKVMLNQQGEYHCRISYNATHVHYSNLTLIIKVPPSLSILSSVVMMKRRSVLQCEAKGFTPPQIFFSWKWAGEVVEPLRPPSDISHTAEGLYQAVSNLTITPAIKDRNVTVSCMVLHIGLRRPLKVEFQPSFVILPSVSVSTIPTSSRSSPLVLSCDVAGFYPENISILWIQNGAVLPDKPSLQTNLERTYNTRRFYTLSQEERELGGEIKCIVHQPDVLEPAFASVNLSAVDSLNPVLTKSAKGSVAMMIISLVLVFLLCLGFSWRRKDEKQKFLNVSGIILPPRVIVGRKGRVTITIEGRRADRVQTAWFLNDMPISDTSRTGSLGTLPPSGRTLRLSTCSEKGPLLPSGAPGYYKLHTQQPLHSSGRGNKQLVSSLTFVPDLSIHKGAVFKCQVFYKGKDKVVAERVSEKFSLLSAPEVSEIKLSEPDAEADIITLTAQASKFHPDIITFRWFCEGGELSPVTVPPKLAAPRPDTQGFFSAVSQCKLLRTELERGGTRVWVSIHHIALKQPVTRETRGFIKKPLVSEITSFPSATSSHNLSLTLGCDITDFYPPDISITWFHVWKSEDGEREEPWDEEQEQNREEVKQGSEIWGPLLTHPRTFRVTAMLRDVKVGDVGSQKGHHIVCRVEHSSMQMPIERVWRQVHIAPPIIPSSLSVNWTSEGVGLFSLLLTGGSPWPKLLWAGGGTTLTQLLSTETKTVNKDGRCEFRSTCALVRSAEPQIKDEKKLGNGRAQNLRTPDLENESITFIDEDEDDGVRRGVKKSPKQREVKKYEEENLENGAKELGIDPSHINTVYVSKEGGLEQRLRVTVEITHPAFALPVYLTWTDLKEDT